MEVNTIKSQTINTNELHKKNDMPDHIFEYDDSDDSYIFNSKDYFRVHRVTIYLCVRLTKDKDIVLIVARYDSRDTARDIVNDIREHGRVYSETLKKHNLDNPLPKNKELIKYI